MRRLIGFTLVAGLLMFRHVTAQATPTAAEIRRQTGVEAGLAVHIGTTDGALETELAGTGSLLVHGLAADETAMAKARETIAAKGIYGLASVIAWSDRTRLPYADNSVNLVVADSAAASDAEVQRILIPGGTAYRQKEGAWQAVTKPRPPEMDNWGHFDCSATGNPVSRDTIVSPVRQQQWITAVQPNPWEGNPAGYAPGAGVRVWGRYVVMDVNDRYTAADAKDRETWKLQCRDAFNGVPLWSLPRPSQVASHRWSLVVDDGRVYTWLKPDGELAALDVATGKVLRTYGGTSAPEAIKDGETACVRAAGKNLVVGLRNRLVCFDATTGAQRWTFAREDRYTLGPVLDANRGRVYCLLAQPGEPRTFGGRWPSNPRTESAVALDLATGHIVWECPEIASKPVGESKGKPIVRGIGQLLPGDKHLIAFSSAAISGGESPYIGAIDLATGKLVHGTDQPFKRDYNVASYNVLWRDGAAWFAGAFTHVWRYDPGTGEVKEVLSHSWNQRCTRFTATPRYFLFGQSAYYKPDFSGEQVCVARSGCAIGNTPANGLTYFTPNACGCATMTRGFQAMTGSQPPPAVPDSQRLLAVTETPSRLSAPARLPEGIVAADWIKQSRAGKLQTDPVHAGGLDLVAVVHQHRLEARRAGQVVWSVTAEARISSPPVIAGDTVVIGSHDGCVYGVSLPDGKLRWKYLLAPAHRLIVVNSQLESTWPVYGVALQDGQVVASAGTHVELAGGVTVAALDPASGRPKWTKRLQKSPSVVPAGGRGAKIVAYSFVNSVPRIEVDRIVLGDGDRKGGSFAFTADETEPALVARLNAPPDPKKR